MEIKIIFEDKDIAVIDKPAGVPVYPSKKSEKTSLLEMLGKKGDFVHRLDNDTSGLIIFAKNTESLDLLRFQFDEKGVLKQYSALVLGETPANGIIETPVIHDPKNKKKMKVCAQKADGKAQEAWTSYETLKVYASGRYSLLNVTIRTGVRHQIRVHLSSIGHPLAGDRLYQNTRQRNRDGTGLVRHFLHSSRIGFHNPSDGKWTEFSIDLPSSLRNVLTKIEDL